MGIVVTRPRARAAKRGRRPKGRSDPRRDILRAALREFAQRGFDRATVRAIAGAARVDPALVYHYFRSKEGLFTEAMRSQMVPPSESELPPGEPRTLQAERVVHLFLERWGGRGEATPLLALLRSAASDPKAATLLRHLFAQQITPRVAPALLDDDVELRVALIGSTLLGLAVLRHILRLEPLASASVEDVGRWVAPVLTRYMTEDLRRKA